MQNPNIKYEEVKQAASEFLKKYHSKQLPVPIEDIVEQQMKIAIVVVPGIKSFLGVDAFISSAFDQITVDAHCFSRFPERTRFSIAHEIGHLILHKNLYEQYGPKNIEDYMVFHDKIDDEVYKFIEIQAQTFAGLVLVPTESLLDELKKRLGRVPSLESVEILAPFIQDLPELFQVSDAVILKRLQREKLVKPLTY